MNEVLKIACSLSLSATILTVVLFVCGPLYRDKLSKRWQYYIWLVVVARLLLPFAPEVNLMETLAGRMESGGAATQQVATPPVQRQVLEENTAAPLERVTVPVDRAEQASRQIPDTAQQLKENLWVLWLGVAALLLVRKVTSYHNFTRFIQAGRTEMDDPDLLDAYHQACEDMGVRRPLPIYNNQLAVSPMLVGILRPYIVLPQLDVTPEEMSLVLRHELVHYKRQDILYKWLVQVALCLHWFNPVVYRVCAEIGKACELSCDEAVIKGIQTEHKRKYGDTLLATVNCGGGYGDAVAAVTLSEDGKMLKERLKAILNFQAGTKWTKAAAVALSAVLISVAAYAGAYAGTRGATQTQAGGSGTVQLAVDEYRYLTTASQGTTNFATFEITQPNVALYFELEGEGAFSYILRGVDTRKIVSRGEQVTFAEGEDPVVVAGLESGKYTVEVSLPQNNGPAAVSVYGAGLQKAGDYNKVKTASVSLPNVKLPTIEVPGVKINLPDINLPEINIPEIDIGDWYNSDSWKNWDSWRHIGFLYEEGYFIGVAWREKEDSADFPRSVQMNVDGTTYTVAFTEDTQAYADNQTVLRLIEKDISNNLIGMKGKSPGSYNGKKLEWSDNPFVVRNALYNTDPDVLLKQFVQGDNFLEFYEMLPHYNGTDAEELLYLTFQQGQELYFMELAEWMPDNFAAEDLARAAVEKNSIIMLSALERFLDPDLYDELMYKCIGFDPDDFKFDFDFEW